ncbi:MAG: TolC family protein [Phaeodactylibacter sp.]|nr:TolC family protein [Phaeodactylibacter sp.]
MMQKKEFSTDFILNGKGLLLFVSNITLLYFHRISTVFLLYFHDISIVFPPYFNCISIVFLKKRYHYSLLLAIIIFPSFLRSQPLDSLIHRALQNNYEIRALHQEYQAALQHAPQVSQLPDPEVGLGIFALPVETRLGPQWVRLGATQMFPWKGKLKAQEDAVLAMARADFERIDAQRLNLRYRISQAYFRLYELGTTQDILRRNLRIFQVLEEIALARVESGKASLADVLRVQSKRLELEKELERLETQKAGPVSAIHQLTGSPAEGIIMPEETLGPAVLPFFRDSLLAAIRENHPALSALQWEQEAARRRIRLNELDGKPDLGFGLDYIFVGKRDDADPERNGRDILSPRVMVQLPLYKKKYDAREREEELKIAALDNRQEDKILQFAAAIESAYADYRDAMLQLELYEEQVKLIRASIEILQASYSNDGARFDELLQLQNDLVNYDKMRLKAIVKTHLAKAEVEKLMP